MCLTRSVSRPSVFALLLLATAGCDTEARDVAADTVRLVEEKRIGSETSGPEYQFSTLSFVVARADDVYVVQRGISEIRVFDAEGRYRRTIGREGAGPGEFQSMWSVGIVGDSLWTIDINLRRLTFFTLGGSLISTVQFEPVPPTLGQGGMLFLPYADIVLRDGGFLGFGRGMASSVDVGDITAYPLLRLDAKGSTVDTLGWKSIRNDDLILRSANSRSYRPQPFTDAPLSEYAPALQRAYLIERWSATGPDAASVRITAIESSGDTAWVRELPYTPAPLENRLIDSVRAQMEREDTRRRYPKEEIARALYAPAFRTPVTAAVASENGSLWIRWDELTQPASLTVLGPDGNIAALVSAPARVRLKWISDSTAWGEELDENDVPTLVRYRISRSR